MRISDWSSDVCSSDLGLQAARRLAQRPAAGAEARRQLDLVQAFARRQLALHNETLDLLLEGVGQRPSLYDSQVVERLRQVVFQIGRASGRGRVCQYV